MEIFTQVKHGVAIRFACRYVTVNEEAERALFYAFAESQSNPREDPLVLWLNGYANAAGRHL